LFLFSFDCTSHFFDARQMLNSDTNVKVKRGEAVRIGELSKATGASPRSLRYYEHLGLINATRLSNGYREYNESMTARVTTIKSLLDVGFPTELIAQILPCTGPGGPVAESCSTLMERVVHLRDDVDDKVRRLSQTRDALARFLADAA
jgi:DNA-binding transcriptional MerR regulator